MVVEEITEGVKNLAVAGDAAAASGGEGQRRGGGGSSNRIQVSNTKKPLFFYVNLAKRYMQQHGDVELSALGMAIATVVTVAEILKNNGFAVEKKIRTSTVEINDESRGRPFQKAKIEIIMGKSDKFDELMAAAAEERGEVEDGVCNLCNGGVRFVREHDPNRSIRYVPLQSESGRKLLQRSGRSPDDISSVVLVEKDRFLRDFVYDNVANNRYAMFGRSETEAFGDDGVVRRCHSNAVRVGAISWSSDGDTVHEPLAALEQGHVLVCTVLQTYPSDP
ncbi:unnamed protein product [Miscanthus lutarioriparius]|uniref:DNA/RNA-binding protein Alba-like domain-containing protein n=1 Tax=Miscanthus lutarioriparius TaxID=422564 RepID=A0A811PH90_9POAL|nr:unnamed protein product [Miscanthus lutarioriparius]